MTYQSVHPMVIEIYCELQLHKQQFLHSWNFAVTNDINAYNNFLQRNDLIWVMKYIYHTLKITSLSCSASLLHNFLHAKRPHKVIWHKTYIFYIYNYAQSSALYMYKISLIQIQITYSHEMAIFTHITHVCISTMIKIQSHYSGWSSFQNNTWYIHQDILSCLTPH